MRLEIAPCVVEVKIKKWRVIGTRASGQDVIDRSWQLVEKSSQLLEIGGVESGAAFRGHLAGRLRESFRVTPGHDDIRTESCCLAGSLEADTRATADHDDRSSAKAGLVIGSHS